MAIIRLCEFQLKDFFCMICQTYQLVEYFTNQRKTKQLDLIDLIEIDGFIYYMSCLSLISVSLLHKYIYISTRRIQVHWNGDHIPRISSGFPTCPNLLQTGWSQRSTTHPEGRCKYSTSNPTPNLWRKKVKNLESQHKRYGKWNVGIMCNCRVS